MPRKINWIESHFEYRMKYIAKAINSITQGGIIEDTKMLDLSEYIEQYNLEKKRATKRIESGEISSMPNIQSRILNKQIYKRSEAQARELTKDILKNPDLRSKIGFTGSGRGLFMKVYWDVRRGKYYNEINTALSDDYWDRVEYYKKVKGLSEDKAKIAASEDIQTTYYGGSK